MPKTHWTKCSRCGEVYASVHPKTKVVEQGEERLCPICTNKLLKGE